jgi:AcrR family transcriptional regulator
MDAAPPPANQALLIAAIRAFGARGLEGASTRDIARDACKPMSAITYHFGGKDGLYLACAQHIAATLGAMLAPAIETEQIGVATGPRASLENIFDNLVSTMVRSETEIFARFVIREQMEPTAAFEILYGGIMGRIFDRITGLLVEVSDGSLPEIDARIHTIALIGQVLAFRVARAAAVRSTGWMDIGADETRQIQRVVRAQLTAILDSLQQGQSA